MKPKDFIVPGIVAAVIVVLVIVLRKPFVPANSQVPVASGDASGAPSTTAPGPAQFAVAPPQLSAGIPALVYALQNPNSAKPPLVNPTADKLKLPDFMILNIPPQRDLAKQQANAAEKPAAPSTCGGCSCQTQCNACKASTANYEDGNGNTQLAVNRQHQLQNTLRQHPLYLQKMGDALAYVQFDPLKAMVQKLNEVTS